MRDRLIELIGSKVCEDYSPTCDEWQPHSCEKCFANSCRIGELADHLIANGVIVSPCKVGDRVWYIPLNEKLTETTVEKIVLKNGGLYLKLSCNSFYETSCRSIGKTVFFTAKEAENALNQRKDQK